MGRCPFQGHWKWLTSLVHPQHLIATILWNIAVFQSRLSMTGKDLPCYTRSFWLSPQGASQPPSEDGKVGWGRGQQPCIHQGGGGDAPPGITQEGLPQSLPSLFSANSNKWLTSKWSLSLTSKPNMTVCLKPFSIQFSACGESEILLIFPNFEYEFCLFLNVKIFLWPGKPCLI